VFVDNSFFDDGNTQRMRFAVLGGVVLHAFIIVWFAMPTSQKMISADMMSAPTHVTIRFMMPVKDTPKPIRDVVEAEPLKAKPVVKKMAKAVRPPPPKILNQIEPAAAPTTKEKRESVTTPKAVPKSIPVVSEKNLKGRRVQPEYPKRALRLRQEGIVLLHVLISETGARQKIKLHKPSQYALLNQAAIKAVKKWTFNPNKVNGHAVPSWVEIPVEFKIR